MFSGSFGFFCFLFYDFCCCQAPVPAVSEFVAPSRWTLLLTRDRIVKESQSHFNPNLFQGSCGGSTSVNNTYFARYEQLTSSGVVLNLTSIPLYDLKLTMQEFHQIMVLTHSNDEDSSPCTFSVCKADDDICLVRNSLVFPPLWHTQHCWMINFNLLKLNFQKLSFNFQMSQIRLNFDTFNIAQPSTNKPEDNSPNGRTQCQVCVRK